jgi:tetratricopeptide (TPR) repeat protein
VTQQLTHDQQLALCISPRHLLLYSYGARGIIGTEKNSDEIMSIPKINKDIAKWAIPYAKSIQKAEELYKKGNIEEAISIFQSLNQEIPNAAIVLLDLGVCYSENNIGKGREYLEKAKAISPKYLLDRIMENIIRLNSANK